MRQPEPFQETIPWHRGPQARDTLEKRQLILELKVIADRFRFTLLSMLHTRIAYPKVGHKPAVPRDETLRPDVMVATRKPETAPPVSAA